MHGVLAKIFPPRLGQKHAVSQPPQPPQPQQSSLSSLTQSLLSAHGEAEWVEEVDNGIPRDDDDCTDTNVLQLQRKARRQALCHHSFARIIESAAAALEPIIRIGQSRVV